MHVVLVQVLVLVLMLVWVVTPKTTGGGSSALDGATDTKAWESRFWKCLLSRCTTSQFTFSLCV